VDGNPPAVDAGRRARAHSALSDFLSAFSDRDKATSDKCWPVGLVEEMGGAGEASVPMTGGAWEEDEAALVSPPGGFVVGLRGLVLHAHVRREGGEGKGAGERAGTPAEQLGSGAGTPVGGSGGMMGGAAGGGGWGAAGWGRPKVAT
jgi:hypothetical protein